MKRYVFSVWVEAEDADAAYEAVSSVGSHPGVVASDSQCLDEMEVEPR